jgi:RNA polymerase sigma-70 factor (ECF subfamily)
MQIRKNHKTQSDEQLILQYKKNQSPRVMSEIWNRYSRLVYGLCLKLLKSKPDALDAVNGIFEKLMLKLPEQNIESFSAWIYTFSKNYCLEILRKNQRRREIFQEYTLDKKSDSLKSTPTETDNESLVAAMNQLPENQKLCLQLFYYQNLSYQEISVQTGLNSGQVKSHLQNGRRNLKNVLKIAEL